MSMYNKYLVISGETTRTVGYQVNDIKTDEQVTDWSGEKLTNYHFIQLRLRQITGEILTIIDASIPEGKQNKCVKDLVRGVFVDEFVALSELLCGTLDVPVDEENVGVPVSGKELLGV